MTKIATTILLAGAVLLTVAGCGVLVPLAIVAVETAVETATPAIVEQLAAKPARRVDDEPLLEPDDVARR